MKDLFNHQWPRKLRKNSCFGKAEVSYTLITQQFHLTGLRSPNSFNCSSSSRAVHLAMMLFDFLQSASQFLEQWLDWLSRAFLICLDRDIRSSRPRLLRYNISANAGHDQLFAIYKRTSCHLSVQIVGNLRSHCQ